PTYTRGAVSIGAGRGRCEERTCGRANHEHPADKTAGQSGGESRRKALGGSFDPEGPEPPGIPGPEPATAPFAGRAGRRVLGRFAAGQSATKPPHDVMADQKGLGRAGRASIAAGER